MNVSNRILHWIIYIAQELSMNGIEDWIVFWKLLLVKNCADQNIVDDESKLLNQAMSQKGEIGQSYLL